MMRIVSVFAFCVLAALPLRAQDAETADRMPAVFDGWMVQNGVENGGISVRY